MLYHTNEGIWPATTYNKPVGEGIRAEQRRLVSASRYLHQMRMEEAQERYFCDKDNGEDDVSDIPVEMTHLILDKDNFIWFGGTQQECEVVMEAIEMEMALLVMTVGTKAETLAKEAES